MERARCWLWFCDTWLVAPITVLIVGSTLVAMLLVGMITTVQDPEAALRSQPRQSVTDFSIGVQVQVLPDRPVGVEIRKIGAQETVRLFEPAR